VAQIPLESRINEMKILISGRHELRVIEDSPQRVVMTDGVVDVVITPKEKK
jgi:hypothetical protein